jgi:hypothetical protein
MGQIHSFDDAEYATITPANGVPMLDWPSDLFSDNANLTDQVTVDLLMQYDSELIPYTQQTEESCVQLAA